MKISVPWVIAGAGIATAIYFLLNQPAPGHSTSTGYDSVDDAADRTAFWGSKQRLAGKGTNVAGKLKEGLGRITGDQQLADEGSADQAIGTVKDAAGKVANAVGQTLHDLNV